MKFSVNNSWERGDSLRVKVESDGVTRLRWILEKHRDKDFVKRIFDPSQTMEMPNGKTGTHWMTVSSDGSGFIVYPRIINNGVELELLDETSALHHARRSGEFIRFTDKENADWFSVHYRDIWKGRYQPDGKSKRYYGSKK